MSDNKGDNQDPTQSKASSAQSSNDNENASTLSYEKTENENDPWTQGSNVSNERNKEFSMYSDNQSNGQRDAKSNSNYSSATNSPSWEKDILNRLAFATLNEQRRSRRWNIFFKSLVFIYLGFILFYIPSDWSNNSMPGGKHTAIIEVSGVIADDAEASADTIITGLRAAFKHKNTAAVILRINSPGGSPVQAGYIYDEIRRLRGKYEDIKLYAVITDMCASGGYYIAAAADEIYANQASIVGSIGVLMNGFGFVDVLKKIGVERRLLTAGEHKGILDPFSPLKKSELKHMQTLLEGVHKQFIDVVKTGRGDRLKDSDKLFSGLFWNGEESVKLGLVDGLGSSSYVAREIVGYEKLMDFTPRGNYFDRFADRIGVSIANVIAASIGLRQTEIR